MEQQDIPAVVEHEDQMASKAAEHEAAIDKEQVEWVFGLTGGELYDRPWEPYASKDGGDYFKLESFRYWYDDKPDYVSDLSRDDEYRTVVYCCLFGSTPDKLYDRGFRFEKVASYVSSGECPCPCADSEEATEERASWADDHKCPLCECTKDEDSPHIYIGDGWCEVVYRAVRVCEECGGELTPAYDYRYEDSVPRV